MGRDRAAAAPENPRMLRSTIVLAAALVLLLAPPALAKGSARAPAKKKVTPPREVYVGLSGVT